MCLWVYWWMWKVWWNIVAWKNKKLYRNLNMEDITDADYMHAKGVCRDFETKNLGQYHYFYLEIDKLLFFDVLKTSEKCV